MAAPLTVGVDARALVQQPTGIGVYTSALLRQFAADGAVRAVAMAHAPLAGLTDDADQVEVEISRVPSGVLWQQTRFAGQARALSCDGLWSPLLTLPWFPRLPAAVTVHDLTPVHAGESHNWKVRASILPFLKRSLGVASQIITGSAHTAQDICQHFGVQSSKITVIPHGVDPDFQTGREADIGATRSELGCDDGYLLYAGTIEPRKNLNLLIDCWLELRKNGSAPPMVVVGPIGWKANEIERRMRQLAPSGLHYLGRLSRRRQVQVMQAASLFVYPSMHEGFGLPLLEAMACGVPVVASNSSSLPEVVGDSGVLFENGSGSELTTQLRRLLSDPCITADLSARGVERAREFTWSRSAEAHRQVFVEAFAQRD